jgi:hypothetical protein
MQSGSWPRTLPSGRPVQGHRRKGWGHTGSVASEGAPPRDACDDPEPCGKSDGADSCRARGGMADAPDLGSGPERVGGSSPLVRTTSSDHLDPPTQHAHSLCEYLKEASLELTFSLGQIILHLGA